MWLIICPEAISSLCTHTYEFGQYEKLVSIVAANGLISFGCLNIIKVIFTKKIYGNNCGIKTV